ncbi:MAG: oxygenase MpaB family protein [Acidimicrobiales bacterium]
MPELLVRTGLDQYSEPAGDPGWFGPDSVAWQVHADLGSMLVGGLSALLLQTLHPLVMAGVADHSDYRHDPFGRLQRTAEFIAATTYGGNELASSLVRRVRSIHSRVRGVAPDERAYSAADPELLRYVHVTEVWSFLGAHQRYSGRPLLTSEKNRYLAEMSIVGGRLGARDVPVSTDEVRRYLRFMRPELHMTPAARATVRFLTTSPPSGDVMQRYGYTTVCEAAIDLLPSWARRCLGLYRPSAVRLAIVRPSATVLTAFVRFAVGDSPILETSRRRACP